MRYIIFIDFTYEIQYSIINRLRKAAFMLLLKSAHVQREFQEKSWHCPGMYGIKKSSVADRQRNGGNNGKSNRRGQLG
ncbi:hypothetical protein AMURIS_04509 [Acetatifactor muris]|uniref:Uncharacterized protein n=1 Tax=Acetatifactor muris TaxID=879566 RepID=A0A2K4ZMR3_9FIRM|nr:hypothetical protein AMURIS_04509 [Acetatifactor muris]